MGLFIFFQVVFDLAVIGTAIWIYLNKKELLTVSNQADSQLLEEWKKSWELEKETQAQQLSLQLRSIRLLYEQTKKLVDEKVTNFSQFPVSQEENELKTLVSEKPQPAIPTLIEFEAQKERLKQDSNLDLRSLLSDQLC
ncbi:MAG: hypothetical protein EBQ92_08850 [Proteobacteria bacterium]|jgi:hypothetical protein|nr:hypothetical protein [Pseudomonadota bacterium]